MRPLHTLKLSLLLIPVVVAANFCLLAALKVSTGQEIFTPARATVDFDKLSNVGRAQSRPLVQLVRL